MATLPATIAEHQWYETQSDSQIAEYIAGQSPKSVDETIRALNHAYRATAGLNFGLDPVNMVPINPVGQLLEQAFQAITGARPPLTTTEIEPVVTWIRTN